MKVPCIGVVIFNCTCAKPTTPWSYLKLRGFINFNTLDLEGSRREGGGRGLATNLGTVIDLKQIEKEGERGYMRVG